MVYKVHDPRLIIPLDFASEAAALEMLDKLDPRLCRVKVGKELFTHAGPALVRKIINLGYEVFLDLKFHDIPVTVANACAAAADCGAWMVNVHALGGEHMMNAAREAIEKNNHDTLLVAVTILTSMTTEDLERVGISRPVDEQVLILARLAHQCGLDGVVCSGREVEMLADSIGRQFKLVTPGIRPAGSDHNDQSRVMTPSEAIHAGSHYLVIGRPVTRANNPGTVLDQITNEIRNINPGI